MVGLKIKSSRHGGVQFILLLQKIPRLALGPNQDAILHRQWGVLPLRVEKLQCTVGH